MELLSWTHSLNLICFYATNNFVSLILGCQCLFIKHSRLEKHVASGRSCKIFQPHTTAENLFSSMYINCFGFSAKPEELRRSHLGKSFAYHLENLPKIEISTKFPKRDTPKAPLSHGFDKIFSEGWALQPTTKERTTFTKKQENYIEKIFEDGRRDKKKAKAGDVSAMMRKDKTFTPSEWLTESQVSCKQYWL